MNGRTLIAIFFFFGSIYSNNAATQYILNGAARQESCNCYTITPALVTQTGSVWNSNKINLQQSFDFWFTVFLGCNDANGADGIVFILQPLSTSIGSSGEGMGFSGVSPSIGIALDTYQNFSQNDPSYDHISIQANGITNHNNDLAGPVPASAVNNNIEDCQWHTLRIKWDAASKVLYAYFDDSLRVHKQIDLVGGIFNNNPEVFWGFTGATGGFNNLQQFCTALNPVFTTNATNNTACIYDAIQFTNASFSFAPIQNYLWNFGDGTIDTTKDPLKSYSKPGSYDVKLTITGQDGCRQDTTIALIIGAIPNATFTVGDTCSGYTPQLHFIPNQAGIKYQWTLDGNTLERPENLLSGLSEGRHVLHLNTTSVYGCGQPHNRSVEFLIKPSPKINAVYHSGCVDTDIVFTGKQLDTTTIITNWNWLINRKMLPGHSVTNTFKQPGTYNIQLLAYATNGCTSLPDTGLILINKAIASAGNDTIAIRNKDFMLQGTGNGSFIWSPQSDLSNSNMANPTFLATTDRQFILKIITPEGCEQTDTVNIKVYDGPAIYVPNAFTPNNDGKNDLLKPYYVGIKALKHFSIYNRWGQLIFKTGDITKGWDGREAIMGTYVWLIEAVNDQNKTIILKGTTTIIR